jgi:lysophospholipase L1-like esterase
MDADRSGRARVVVWLVLSAAGVAAVILLQACLGRLQAPPAPPSAVEQRLAAPGALGPFFAALAALDRRQAERPVRIMQIGDSHTANDALSGRLREQFQQRFGDAGRGWLPAGIPFNYYRPRLVSVSETGWHHVKPSDHSPGLVIGLDAVAAQSEPPEAIMAIESTDPGGFDRFAIEFVTRPRGSAFTLQIDDGEPIRVSTAAARTAVARFERALDRPAHRLELRSAGRPPVDLLGWAVERRASGVIYENHGTIGATVDLLAQMTPEAVSYELAERRPALLVVAFGTNEGFVDGLDLDRYAQRFRDAVAELQRRAPQAAVLILGTPDANRVDRGCQAAACGSAAGQCTWQEPPKLAGVRDVQRRVAREAGWAYWDWFQAMGGTCSIDRMAGLAPALAAPDHVHLTKAGYEGIADALFGDLMNAYGGWKSRGPNS